MRAEANRALTTITLALCACARQIGPAFCTGVLALSWRSRLVLSRTFALGHWSSTGTFGDKETLTLRALCEAAWSFARFGLQKRDGGAVQKENYTQQ